MLIRLPDDGTGALPLLRNITLNDDKSSTYKLALLRVLCRVASGASGLARYIGDDYVDLPFGLVGLYWVRAFHALLLADMPQSSLNRGLDRLGFVRDGFSRDRSTRPFCCRPPSRQYLRGYLASQYTERFATPAGPSD